VLLAFDAAIADPPEAVEAHGALQRAFRFALVELGGCLAAQRRVLEPVEGEQRPFDTADLAQGEREPVLARIGAKSLQHQRGAHRTGADGGREAKDVVPMGSDPVAIETAGDEWLEHGPSDSGTEGVKPTIVQVRDAWREAKTKQLAERKDVVAHAAAIGMVDSNVEISIVVEKPVNNVRGLAGGRRQELDVERRVAAGEVMLSTDIPAN